MVFVFVRSFYFLLINSNYFIQSITNKPNKYWLQNNFTKFHHNHFFSQGKCSNFRFCNCNMVYNQNCIEIVHFRVVQLNVVHDIHICVQNVHANVRLLEGKSMELAVLHLPYNQKLTVEQMYQLENFAQFE